MRTRRVNDSTSVDEDALQAMHSLLQAWGAEEIAKRQQETDDQGLGKRITLRTTFNNADELLSTFRLFCKSGWIDAVNTLLSSKGSDFFVHHASKKYNETALTIAAKYGRQEVVVALIKAGSDINYHANGGSALIWNCRSYSYKNFKQCESGIVATAHYLIDAGADVNEVCDGRTPLHHACQNQSVPLILLLRAKGAKVSSDMIDSAASEDIRAALVKPLHSEQNNTSDTSAAPVSSSSTTKQLHNPLTPDVMISLCCRTQMQLATKLRDFLHARNISTFLCMDMGAGQIYRNEIIVAAASSRFFIPLIDLAWADSRECEFETNIALRNSLIQSRPVIAPVVPDATQFNALNEKAVVMGIFCNANAEFVDPTKPEESFERLVQSITSLSAPQYDSTIDAKQESSETTATSPAVSQQVSSKVSSSVEVRLQTIEQSIQSLSTQLSSVAQIADVLNSICARMSKMEEDIAYIKNKM